MSRIDAGGTYCGETDGKRLARAELYKTVVRWWESIPPSRSGYLFGLAGPTAHELGAWKHILCWPAERCVVVDINPAGVDSAQQRMPGCIALCGDARDAIAAMRTDAVSLAHLDFMGHATDVVVDSLKSMSRRIVPGGMLALTYLSGRERSGSARWDEIRACGNAYRQTIYGRNETPPSAVFRPGAYTAWVQRYAKDIHPVFSGAYRSRRSTMGVIMWRRDIRGERDRKRRPKFGHLEGGQHALRLRREVLGWVDRGWPLAPVAEIFNLAPATISAWRAHRTMGTYASAWVGIEDTAHTLGYRNSRRWAPRAPGNAS